MTNQLVDRIRDALRVVIDPELGHNIVDLGFVYDISVVDGAVRITMTATTPGCPAIRFLKEGVANAAARVPGVALRRHRDDVRSALGTLAHRAGRPRLARLRRSQLKSGTANGAYHRDQPREDTRQGRTPHLIRLCRYARIGMPTEQAGPLPRWDTERLPPLEYSDRYAISEYPRIEPC